MIDQLRRRDRGQVLAGVILLMLVLLILVPAMVQWSMMDSKAAVQNRRSTTAFNLAQAAVERGYWEVKNSTLNVQYATGGTVIPGYNFDVTYHDVSGGTYRIKFSSGPSSNEVTIVGEGRDSSSNQTRAISAVYKNQTLYSPIMSQGSVLMTRGMTPNWGPVMSQGDIVINDDDIGNLYYPLKYAQGVVWCNSTAGGTCTNTVAKNARDMNGLAPPNTDGSEWWSDYQYVPEVPLLDFATFRSSATATNTLNVYGCSNSTTYTNYSGVTGTVGAGPWDKRAGKGGCASLANTGVAHNLHFGNSWNHPKSIQFSSTNTYTWYWDGDVVLAGTQCPPGTDCGNGTGIVGNVIVRGNLTIDSPGDYTLTEHVPVNAWQQHERITKTTNDTAASGEYPADIGFHNSNTTFKAGLEYNTTLGAYNYTGDSFSLPGYGAVYSTPGIKGFVYVGGNLFVQNSLDINGVVWVKGQIGTSGTGLATACGVFYDDTLSVPTLNVILIKQQWQEVQPSATVWN